MTRYSGPVLAAIGATCEEDFAEVACYSPTAYAALCDLCDKITAALYGPTQPSREAQQAADRRRHTELYIRLRLTR